MLRVAYHFKAVSFNFCFINFPISLQTCISEDIYQVDCIHTKKQYSYGLFWHASPWRVRILEAITVNAMFWATGVKILRISRTRDEGQGHEAWIQKKEMDFCEHTGGEQTGVYLNNKSALASDFQSYHYILSCKANLRQR